jgi:hypothetical protein
MFFINFNPFPLISIPQINWGNYIIAVKTIKNQRAPRSPPEKSGRKFKFFNILKK